MADRIGQRLGNYRLISLLGKGGFAEVYLGEHLRLKTQAAIKVLHTSLEVDDVEGFLREAQTVARLKHPHIVRVFDFDVEAHTPFLVMDYLPNGNVRRSHSKGTPLLLTTIVSYVTQIASALQYAHDEKLIHRDIKPENMLLDRDNTLVLSDFGIALMAQSSRYQSKQEVAGTAAYMAPEQFQGKPRRASDQYALSVVVYEWLCGDRPFHGSFGEIASQHLFVPPPPLRGKVPTISADVEQVVLRALEKDPHKRFASIQDFATALEQAYQREAFRPVTLPTEITLLKHPTPPTDKFIIIPPNKSLQQTDAVPPSPTPAVLPSSIKVFVPSGKTEQSTGHISRRVFLSVLAGVAVAGGGVTWLVLSQQTSTSSQQPSPISYPHLAHAYRGSVTEDTSQFPYTSFYSPSPLHGIMTLSSIVQIQNHISGGLMTNPPLNGIDSSGHFTGNVDTDGKIHFILTTTDGTPSTNFLGNVQSDGSLKGSCSPYSPSVATFYAIPIANWKVSPS